MRLPEVWAQRFISAIVLSLFRLFFKLAWHPLVGLQAFLFTISSYLFSRFKTYKNEINKNADDDSFHHPVCFSFGPGLNKT